MVRYLGAAGKAARYLGARADSALYLGADSLWPSAVDPYIFDPLTSGTIVTISNGGKTATFGTSSQYVIGRMAAPVYGKAYIEVTIVARGTGAIGFGLGSAGAYAQSGNYSTQGAGWYSYGPNIFIGDGVVGVNYGSAFSTGMIISIEYDSDADTIRFRQNGGTWSTTYSTASVGKGLFPFVYMQAGNSASFTVNTGQSAFVYTPTSGYGAPDPAAIAGGGSTYTLMTTAGSSLIGLSGGNLTATQSGSNGNFHAARTVSRVRGKVYWEYTIGYANGGLGLGFCSDVPNLNGGAYIWIGMDGGQFSVWRGFTAVGNFGSGLAYSVGDVISLACDVDGGFFQLRRNGGAWTSNIYHGFGAYLYPSILTHENGEAATLNMGATAFAYSPPAGYAAAA